MPTFIQTMTLQLLRWRLAAVLAGAAVIAPGSAGAQDAEALPEIVVEGAVLETAKAPSGTRKVSSKKPPGSAANAGSGSSGAPPQKGAAAGDPQADPPVADVPLAPTEATANSESGVGRPVDRIGSAVAVVTGEELRAQQIRTAADALRSLPGVHVSRTNGTTGLSQVRIRGAEANHTLVMIDGIKANDATNGEFDFSDLSTGDIERIEVIRGAQSSIYGAGAVGGVINIVTKSGKGPLTFEAFGESGSFAARELGGAISAGNANVWGRIALSKRETGGFNIAPQGPENDSGELSTFVLKGGAKIAEGLTLDGVLRHINKSGDRDTEGAVLGQLQEQKDDPASFSQEGWLQGIALNWSTLGGQLSQTVRATRNETHRTDHSPTFFFDSDYLGETITYNYTGTLRFGAPLDFPLTQSITWLAENEKERFTPASVSFDPFFPSKEDGFARVRNHTSFAGEWAGEFAGRLDLTAGVRHDDNDTFDDFTTWRTTASLRLPEVWMRPHASAGTSVKAPTMFEQYGAIPSFFTPNPNLDPEESFGWDAGLELASRGRRYVLDVTYFDAYIENQINGLAPGPNFTFTAVNRGGASSRAGIEVAASAEIIRGLTLSGAYTYLDATTSDGLAEFRRPQNAGRAGLTYIFDGGKGSFNAGVIYNGEMDDAVRRVNGFFFGFPVLAAERFTLDDYLVVNVAASYEVMPGVELYGRVENAFNEDYQEIYGFETADVAGYAGVRFKFEEEQTRAWSEGR